MQDLITSQPSSVALKDATANAQDRHKYPNTTIIWFVWHCKTAKTTKDLKASARKTSCVYYMLKPMHILHRSLPQIQPMLRKQKTCSKYVLSLCPDKSPLAAHTVAAKQWSNNCDKRFTIYQQQVP